MNTNRVPNLIASSNITVIQRRGTLKSPVRTIAAGRQPDIFLNKFLCPNCAFSSQHMIYCPSPATMLCCFQQRHFPQIMIEVPVVNHFCLISNPDQNLLKRIALQQSTIISGIMKGNGSYSFHSIFLTIMDTRGIPAVYVLHLHRDNPRHPPNIRQPVPDESWCDNSKSAHAIY